MKGSLEEVIANNCERYEIKDRLDFIEAKLTEVEKQIHNADKWLDKKDCCRK